MNNRFTNFKKTSMVNLYRGFLYNSSQPNNGLRLESGINIANVLQRNPQMNPHAYENELIWASSDINYAKRVIATRFLSRYILEADFAEKVQKGEIWPALAIYEIPDEVEYSIYSATNTSLTAYNPNSLQYVLQKADSVKTKYIHPDSLFNLIWLLEQKDISDFIDRVFEVLCQNFSVSYEDVKRLIKEKKEITQLELFRKIINTYFKSLLTDSASQELFGEAIFGALGLYRYTREAFYQPELELPNFQFK